MAELARKNQKEKTQFDELRNDFDRKMAEIKERNRLELASVREKHKAEMAEMAEMAEIVSHGRAAGPKRSDSTPKASAPVQSAKFAFQEKLASQHRRSLEQQTARQSAALMQSKGRRGIEGFMIEDTMSLNGCRADQKSGSATRTPRLSRNSQPGRGDGGRGGLGRSKLIRSPHRLCKFLSSYRRA
jgi:hypothetical protein